MLHRQDFYLLWVDLKFALQTTEQIQQPIRLWHDNKTASKVIEAGTANFEMVNMPILYLWARFNRLHDLVAALSSTDEQPLEELKIGEYPIPEWDRYYETDGALDPESLLEGLYQATKATNARISDFLVTVRQQRSRWITPTHTSLAGKEIRKLEQEIRRDFAELQFWLDSLYEVWDDAPVQPDVCSKTEGFGPEHSAHKGFTNGCAKLKKVNSPTEITVQKIGDWGLEKVPPENITKLQNRFDTWGCPKCIGRYAHLCHLGIDLGPEDAIWDLHECPKQARSREEFEQWSKDWKAENHWYLEECIEDYLNKTYPSEQEDILAYIKAWEPDWEPPASK